MEQKKSSKILKSLKSFLKKNNMIVLLGCAGLLLVIMASSFFNEGDAVASEDAQAIDCEEYVTQLEQRLGTVLSGIPGVESCEVMITLKTGVEYVYEKDVSDSGSENDDSADSVNKSAVSYDKQTTVAVISDKASGEKALVISEIYPEINGVAVICSGSDSATVKLSVINAVSTVLGISSGRVCVIMKG